MGTAPEGLEAVQEQHAATGGQARLDTLSIDFPLSHLSPKVGQVT